MKGKTRLTEMIMKGRKKIMLTGQRSSMGKKRMIATDGNNIRGQMIDFTFIQVERPVDSHAWGGCNGRLIDGEVVSGCKWWINFLAARLPGNL
jgi:hypothetical protein